MKFSIRDLLALVLLFALGMLAWRTLEEAQRDRARVALLQAEIKSLETGLRLDQPVLHQAILHTLDELESLDAMRDRSLAQFDVLRQKYSTIVPQGANVFSIRGIPILETDSEPAPVIFRMWVPEERPVWLKFGVHMAQASVSWSRLPDDHDLLSQSPFGASGPFELRLLPGDQSLTIAAGSAHNGSIPLRIALSDEDILRSSFDSTGISGTTGSHISAPSQLDLGPNQQLPWLLTTSMLFRKPEREKVHAFSLWLSDHPSNFKPFPGDIRHEQVETEARR